MDERQKEILTAFGRRVRELRRATGLSQEDFAYHADLDRTYVSGIERGHRNATVLTVYRLAAALSVQPADLLLPSEERR